MSCFVSFLIAFLITFHFVVRAVGKKFGQLPHASAGVPHRDSRQDQGDSDRFFFDLMAFGRWRTCRGAPTNSDCLSEDRKASLPFAIKSPSREFRQIQMSPGANPLFSKILK